MKKKIYPLIIIVFSLFLSLACEFANAAVEPAPMRVESVDVTPKGAGVFTASVGIWAHKNESVLHCYIPRKSSNEYQVVYEQKVPAAEASRILEFEFTMTEPGVHKLYCRPKDGDQSAAKTEFTVPEAQPTPDQGGSGSSSQPAPGQPIKIKSSGEKTSIQEENSCASTQEAILIIQADGSAILSVYGPGFIDHINCVEASGMEAWYLAGTANAADETVTFTSCNDGGFNAQGSVKYAGGALAGEATCLYKQGDAAGKPAMKIKVP